MCIKCNCETLVTDYSWRIEIRLLRIMKKNLFLIWILLSTPAICFCQFYASGGYQKGGHGSGGGLPVGKSDKSLTDNQDQIIINPNLFKSEIHLNLILASL